MAASRAQGDDLKDVAVRFRYALADVTDTCEVAVDAARTVQLGPEVDEDEIAGRDRRVVGAGGGLEVGIAAVRAGPDDGGAVGRQAVDVEVVHDRGLHLTLPDGAPTPTAIGDQAPGQVEGRGGEPLGLLVHGPLVLVPGGFKKLDQVA